MNRFQAASPCECEALLTAVLDDQHHVLEGWATHRGGRESAPAHSMNAALPPSVGGSAPQPSPTFDLGWLCPFCGRNTLRTFYAGALRTLPALPAPPAAAPVPADGAAPKA